MFKLTVGKTVEWLYEGPKALKRAKFAARLLMRRLGVKVAYITPYGMDGETLIVSM